MSSISRSLKLFRSTWGCLESAAGSMNMQQVLSKAKADGACGIEIPLILALEHGKEKLISELSEYDMEVIIMIFTDGPNAPGDPCWQDKYTNKHPVPSFTPQACAHAFKAQVEEALDFNPLKINSHSSYIRNDFVSVLKTHINHMFVFCYNVRDFFTFSEAQKFFDDVLPFQQQISEQFPGLKIMHETHRKRFFHSPWVCRDFITKSNSFGPEMKLVADFSHFTCVAETDASDPHLNEVIMDLMPRISHTHGRVGYDHGPQVSDPRAPEWMPYTLGFEHWWDSIIQAQLKKHSASGSKEFVTTFTPEHGPPNYQPALPYTQQPIADIWELNTWIGNRAKQRFETLVETKKQ